MAGETTESALKNIIQTINKPVLDVFKRDYLEQLPLLKDESYFRRFIEGYINNQNGKITSTIFEYIAKNTKALQPNLIYDEGKKQRPTLNYNIKKY